jgi:hypothetical protein
MEVSGQLHAPSQLIPRGNVPWIGGCVGSRAGLDSVKIKSFSPAENRTLVVQPVPHCYTEWAFSACNNTTCHRNNCEQKSVGVQTHTHTHTNNNHSLVWKLHAPSLFTHCWNTIPFSKQESLPTFLWYDLDRPENENIGEGGEHIHTDSTANS